MPMRVTGMFSGLDTESIIQELVAVKRTKVDDLKKEQTKLQWKQDAWKDLNTRLRKLFDGTLNSLQYQSSYMKKATSVSNSNLVSIITSDAAMDSVQSLEIKKLAKAGYLTGGEIAAKDGKKITSGSSLTEKLGIEAGSKIEVTTNGKTTEIEITEGMTVNDFVGKLQSAGVKASFDAENQRLFIGADGMGAKSDFTITAANEGGTAAIEALGILAYDEDAAVIYEAYAGLANDPQAFAKEVAAKESALLKAYGAEKEKLQKEVSDLKDKQAELVKAYEEAYGKDSKVDIEDQAQREARQTSLKQTVEDLKKQLEDETLSEEKKTELTNQLNKAEGELSYLDGYDKNASAMEEKQQRIDELAANYINADGTAGAKLKEEANAYVQAKVDEAVKNAKLYEEIKNLSPEELEEKGIGIKVSGQAATILLNGAVFTSESNTFNINGLTITCKGVTEGEVITLTTENDVSGIYDMVKDFITEYSTLINEMDKLYNAESDKGYEPLTDEEKDAMSESEVEKWEKKIKDALLRKDSNLSTVSGVMKEIMASGFEVNGKKMYLSDFGIETLGYFNSADNEKNAYHIHGDEDDAAVKNEENKLKAMISSDPDTVVSFFTQLSKSLYGKLDDLMKRTDYRSSYSIYDDKKMKEEYDEYTIKIKEAEKKLTAYEDKWYSKFSAMETAMAKMQSNASAIMGILGG